MSSFSKNTGGNVAMIAALVGVPLVLMAGSAIDYANMIRKNTAMQNAVDSALLYVAPDSRSKNKLEIEKEIRNHLKVHLPPSQYLEINKIEIIQSDKKNALEVQVAAKHPTNLLGLAGFPTLNYNPLAKVQLNGKRFEIALVLDTTFSMTADKKIDALKASASSFVNQLMDLNINEEKIKIGIVPFAKYVNVGVHNKNKFWLDVPNSRTENICITDRPVVAKSGCSMQTFFYDGAPYEAEQCTAYEYGNPVETCKITTYDWAGCVGSRDYPLNIKDQSYGTRVPGIDSEAAWCPAPILPLTASRTTLLDSINSLAPYDDTYIPAGLTWGLRTLSAEKPITGGTNKTAAASTNTKKMMILMSDGENFSSIDPSDTKFHTGTDIDQANAMTLETCDEIKDEDITLYTIGFGSGISADTETMLRNCSTNGANYFKARDSNKLGESFDKIATAVASLYLSK